MPVAVACLVATLLAATPANPENPPMLIDGDLLSIEEGGQRWVARGHAMAGSANVVLHGDEIVYEPLRQRAIARGNAMMVSGLLVAIADEIEVNIESVEATAVNGQVLQKANVTTEALIAAKTPDELRKLGKNTVAISGRKIRRVGPGEFLVDGVSFTPCDCDPTRPSWRVSSTSANIIAGERATLWWPVVYVYKVPVLALPWMYLPLADRRSGLLIPRPATTALNGFTIDVPIFVTLGRSYDLTLTPGYYAGATYPNGGSEPDSGQAYGIKGPRLLTEFEYAPSDKTRGSARLGFIYDLRQNRKPVDATLLDGAGRRGLRAEGALVQTQDLGGGFYDNIYASFVSDGNLAGRDVSANIFAREAQYIQSTAVLYHRDADSYAGADVGIRQDLRWGYGFFDNARRASDLPDHGPNSPHKLPELVYELPERHLAGPIFGGARIDYVRLAPFAGSTIFDPISLDPVTFDPGEREARDRIDLRPHVSASFAAGRFARFTPYAAYREDLYLGELSGTALHRGYPMFGATLDTEVSRTFGPGGSFRHSLTPSVEVRYVPRVFGSGPSIPYDEIDLAVPREGFLQGVVQLRQKISRRDSTANLVRFDVGQGFDLKNGAAADAFARILATYWKLNANAVSRYDVHANRIAQVSTGIAFNSGTGIAVGAQYENLIQGGPDRLRKGIDMLVGPPSTLVDVRAQNLSLGVSARFNFGLAMGYDVLFSPTLKDPADPNSPAPWSLVQQAARISFSPSCDCWRLEVGAFLAGRELKVPDFNVTLTLARFGSFGTSTFVR